MHTARRMEVVMLSWELLFGVGVVAVFGALVWGMVQSKTRNKANDRITEQATAAQYKDPDTYAEKRAELNKQIKRS
jgi:hypothetical protein